MKKILVASLLTLAFCVVGLAKESDGIFVGFEVGLGSATLKTNGIDLANQVWDNKSTATNAGYGGKIGYKHFFSDYLGVRGYFGINWFETMGKNTTAGTTSKTTISILSYSLNADALFNFYSNESANYGAFVGLGLGGASSDYEASSLNESVSGFYMDAKLGLRATAGHNGFDFIVAIPFIDQSKTINGVKAKIKQDYRISLAYSYMF